LRNRVLRRVFVPKTDEVTGEWRKLHNEELNELYSSSTIVRVIKLRRWARHVAYIGKRRGVCRERYHRGGQGVDWRIILRWMFRKCDVGVIDWIELVQDIDMWRELVNAVMNLRVPYNSGNFVTNCKPVSFS
jgi:hypothetical protein